MLYSFDVFDTLITRRVAEPRGIFAIMSEIIKNEHPNIYFKLGQHFYDLRVQSEEKAARLLCRKGREDITLDDIYVYMGKSSALTEDELRLIKELELQIELTNIVAINANIERVVQLKRQNKRVVLISDMYLNASQILKMLISVDKVFEDIPIYVSSEYGKTKHSGNLFYEVRKCERCEKDNWIHIGDNVISDYKVPREIGIRTEMFKYEPLMDCEKVILDKYIRNPDIQLYIGASRNYRIEHGNSCAIELGTAYGAAILYSYTKWVMSMARLRKIDTLYFVARDGYILREIAEIINSKEKNTFRLQYIYGSRKAWKPLAIGDEACFDIEKLFKGSIDWECASLFEIASVMSLTKEELYTVLKISETDYKFEKKYNLKKMVDTPLANIHRNKDLKELLIDRHRRNVEMTDAYLRQELDLSQNRIAFVELHGTGATQEILCDYLKEKCGVNSDVYYYIIDQAIDDNRDFFSYMVDTKGTESIIEGFARALHGRTIGYYLNESVVEPILEDDENRLLADHQYCDYINSVKGVISNYVDGMIENKVNAITNEMGKLYYDYFVTHEDGQVLEYFCDIPMSNTYYGVELITSIVPQITNDEIESLKKSNKWSYKGLCLTLSIKRSGLGNDFEKAVRKSLEEEFHRRKSYVINENALLQEVVIYGAGKVGNDLYKQLLNCDKTVVVAWVDKKYMGKEGLRDSVKHILNYKFDQVLIAIKNEGIAKDIMMDLLEIGISEEKIYWEDYGVVDSM